MACDERSALANVVLYNTGHGSLSAVEGFILDLVVASLKTHESHVQRCTFLHGSVTDGMVFVSLHSHASSSSGAGGSTSWR